MGEDIVKQLLKYGIIIGIAIGGLLWLLIQGIIWLTNHIHFT